MGIPKRNHAVRPEAIFLKMLLPSFPSLDDADKTTQPEKKIECRVRGYVIPLSLTRCVCPYAPIPYPPIIPPLPPTIPNPPPQKPLQRNLPRALLHGLLQ